MKKGTNAAAMRIKNEKIILSLINRGHVSRVDIAKKTGLTKAAVTIIIDDLKQRKIVNEQEEKTKTVGRNPVILSLNETAFYIIGVNIARHHITVGITDLGGNIISQDDFAICQPYEATQQIKRTIDEQIKKSEIDISKIYKISVVTPGPVDTQNGVILNPPNFKDWHNFPIVSKLESLTGIEVVLENVSSATAIAEKYFGAAFATENFLTLQIDEGVGSGIVINDALFKGPSELGHTSIKYDGEKCECGNHGCLEMYASMPQILKTSAYNKWSDVVDNNEESILSAEAEYLSVAIISANNIFNFEKIVLCGDLTYKFEKIVALISSKVEKNILAKDTLEICAGMVKSKLLIASSVGINSLFT